VQIYGTQERQWIYDGQLRPVAEMDGTGALVSQFVYATHINVPDYIIKGGVTYRIITDHLGSLRFVIDVSTGTIAQRMDYDDWGNVLVNTAPDFTPFGFAGGMYDRQTKLVRFGARDYDAELGRWLRKDENLFARKSLNLYAYCKENPIGYIDASGWVPRAVDRDYGLPPEFWDWYHRRVKRPGDPDLKNSLLKSPCVSSWDGVPPPKADELPRDRENPGRKPVGSLSKEEAEEYYREWDKEGRPEADHKGKHRPSKCEAVDTKLPVPFDSGFNKISNFCEQYPMLCVAGFAAATTLIVLDPVPGDEALIPGLALLLL